MNIKIKWSIVAVLATFLGWYFFIKESDYTITFNAKTATGTIFQGIQEWSTTQNKNQNEIYTILEKRNFDFIKQQAKDTEIFCFQEIFSSLPPAPEASAGARMYLFSELEKILLRENQF